MPVLERETNRQYAYINLSIYLSLPKQYRNGQYMVFKFGESTKNSIEKRVKAQNATALTIDNVELVSAGFEIDRLKEGSIWEADTELDNKIREDMDDHNVLFKHLRKEWMIGKITSVLKEFGEKDMSEDLFHSKKFQELLGKFALKHRLKSANKLFGKKSVGKIFELKKHQQTDLDKMITADKMNNVLHFCPRYGKTVFVLDAARVWNLQFKGIKLLVLSKNLAANESFEIDSEDRDYPYEIANISLYRDRDYIIEKINAFVKKGDKLVIVTDEADRASGTAISLAIIDEVLEKFNVVRRIIMSGTGIHKLRLMVKNIPVNEIYYASLYYTEMLAIYKGVPTNISKIVKPKWIDILFKMVRDSKLLNIRQSLANKSTYDETAEFFHELIISKDFEHSLDASMVFIGCDKKDLISFAKFYGKKYKDVHDVLIITGDTESNRTAQASTKKRLKNIKFDPTDQRHLVIFSQQMGDRSYSVPQIGRIIVATDNAVTETDYQKFARVLTWQTDKEFATLIRVSFTEFSLAEDIIKIEDSSITYDAPDVAHAKVKNFLNLNSFSMYEWTAESGFIGGYNGGGQLYDALRKMADTVNRLTIELFNISDDIDITITVKGVTKTITTSDLSKKKLAALGSTGSNTPKTASTDTVDSKLVRMVKAYSQLIRIIPAVTSHSFGVTDVEGLLALPNSSWIKVFQIPQDEFIRNCENELFLNVIASVYRMYKEDEDEDIRLDEYFNINS